MGNVRLCLFRYIRPAGGGGGGQILRPLPDSLDGSKKAAYVGAKLSVPGAPPVPRFWDWGGDGDSWGPARDKVQNPPTPNISFILGFRPLYFGNMEKK